MVPDTQVPTHREAGRKEEDPPVVAPGIKQEKGQRWGGRISAHIHAALLNMVWKRLTLSREEWLNGYMRLQGC